MARQGPESIMMHSFFGIGDASPRGRGPRVCGALAFLMLTGWESGASAQNPATGETTAHDESARAIGATLDPSSPQATALPGGMTPAFGQRSLSSQDWRFDFHGLVTAPLNAGFNRRPNAGSGQSTTVLHAPPVVPDDFETFSHTGVVPTTYAQLNLSDGNNVVSANVSILARQANVSESFLEPSSQLGISDAFLSYLPQLGESVKMRIIV
ncbi:MAG: hypothetical protein JOZ69_09265, partial [Myxococcales bacterium]|nr:hypothetical protein [Myxococcales bacterium]